MGISERSLATSVANMLCATEGSLGTTCQCFEDCPGPRTYRGHPNLRGANPCVGFSPFVDFFGVLSLFYEAGQPPSQLAREYAPMPNLSISSQGTT